ncbi:MAG: serine/threonine protein phosphatase [Anaerolineaceae bacterium]|nr:MAG: serine/threonine protein phosphatase [Anaerolineaceae bacterium]
MSRTLVIGDIHGCYKEMMKLLDKAGVNDDDQIISLGDMVNRGPDSARVLDFFRYNSQYRVRAVLGNHEHKHIRARHQNYQPTVSMMMTRWQFGADYDDAVAYMDSLPDCIRLPEAILAHAYFEPGIPLTQQKHRVLVGTMGASSYLKNRYRRPWWELYDGGVPIIVGHKDMSGKGRPFHYRDRVFGLDSGCVYGGKLSAIWLPEFRFVTVKARQPHWRRLQQKLQPME